MGLIVEDQELAHLHPAIRPMIKELVPTAKAEAWRAFSRARHALDRQELESIAFTGLMQAAVRWPSYCSAKGYSPDATHYFAYFTLRRMRGAILDYLRSLDWVTRQTRQQVKAIRAAEEDHGRTEAELASETGLSVEQIRRARYLAASGTIGLEDVEGEITAPAAVESQSAAGSIVAAAVSAYGKLDIGVQAVLALRYYEGVELRQVAVRMEIPSAEVAARHRQGVIAIREAMATAALEAG